MKVIWVVTLGLLAAVYWRMAESSNLITEQTLSELPATSVVMFATPSCGACKRARAYFRDRNIDYVEYDMEHSALARRRKLSHRQGVPLFITKVSRYLVLMPSV